MFHMCPHCYHLLLAGSERSGQRVTCRNCQASIRLPVVRSFQQSPETSAEHGNNQTGVSTLANPHDDKKA
jgi:hypothetical protein